MILLVNPFGVTIIVSLIGSFVVLTTLSLIYDFHDFKIEQYSTHTLFDNIQKVITVTVLDLDLKQKEKLTFFPYLYLNMKVSNVYYLMLN